MTADVNSIPTQPISIFRKAEAPVERIPLVQQDIEDFVARTNAIEYLNTKRQEHLDEALRCEKIAIYLQEALTLWVERNYHVDIAREQWHLDLNERLLVRVPPTGGGA